MIKYFLLTMLLSASAFAGEMNHFKTCSNPLLIEGELQVSVSRDKTKAVVSLSGIVNYPTTIVAIGPVSAFDYDTGRGIERVIIAVDGGHELHAKDARTNNFRKIGDLTCY